MNATRTGNRGFARSARTLAAALAALFAGACDDLLTVSDPQRYTTTDLDEALEAVANGVEGAVHAVYDTWVIDQALLGDVYQHTGTWSGYDDSDHGRTNYNNNATQGEQNSWLRARWFAVDAEERFKRVLGEAEAANSALTAQVQLGGALADMMLGMTACESVTGPTGDLATALQILAQAEQKLTTAMNTATSAGRTDYAHAAQAARAQTRLLMDDLSGAAADAAAIPSGFVYSAVFNEQSTNSIVQLTTKTNNEAAGLMYKWWDRIDESDEPGFMKDPYSDMPDKRLPVYFDGEVATDNETPHYSQWKYTDDADDVPMLHSDGMQLILAEAAAVSGDYAGAIAILNDLRAAVDLPGHEVPTDQAEMAEILLSERFAEHFMEGWRLIDLHRTGAARAVFEELDDPERPITDRPTKWPMSATEATYNPGVDDDITQRCLPTMG